MKKVLITLLIFDTDLRRKEKMSKKGEDRRMLITES
jgi:hypothetical protein